ncbi:enoyl-CoA delta isomerase 1, peroxisomal-like [Salvia divinorum]|uniref:Delta(3)-Delta(2)-enoyl-CoA isomerase n=1 Tax=Salvia divinorum TaxID=28513 RepID=A0ABD1GFN7_SALDI
MCTLQRCGDVSILTITGDDDHRLNPTLIDSIRAALARVKSDPARSAALVTTAEGDFYSSGYDLAWARSGGALARARVMSEKLRLLVEDLISLPMPTIAAVNGNASAAGFILALSHDYVLMREDVGRLSMGELEINYRLSMWFVRVLRNKIGSPQILRDVILRAEKIDARRGVEWGIVDSVHATAAATVAAAVEMGADMAASRWDGKLYAANRRTVFAEVLAILGSDETVGDSSADKGRSKM